MLVSSMSDHRYRTARWRKLRKAALDRDGWRCTATSGPARCNRDLRPKGMGFADHIIEVRDGGPFWDLDNLQSLCKPHHDAKTLAVKADRREPQSPNG